METLGERIRGLRTDRGITQADLAKQLSVSQPELSLYEHNRRRPQAATLVQMARLFGVTADELLGISKSKPNRPPAQRRFLKRLRQIDTLSDREQKALLQTIDAFLERARLKRSA